MAVIADGRCVQTASKMPCMFLGPGCCGDDRVLLGEDGADLPVRPVAAVSMSGHPELDPVALSQSV